MACETFNITDDDVVECAHDFTVSFDSIDNCVVDPPITSASPSAVVVITDNDGMLIPNLCCNKLHKSFFTKVFSYVVYTLCMCHLCCYKQTIQQSPEQLFTKKKVLKRITDDYIVL